MFCKLRQATDWLKKKFATRGLILMYHRVAEQKVDPWSLCVTPQHFAEHLEILQKEAFPISLGQLVQAYKNGNIPHRAVAVTFDDGYADNLYNAKPLLEQYDIPATVFVATGQVGKEREFWWDELERILLQPGKLPETLSININGKAFEWDLNKTANYKDDSCVGDTSGITGCSNNYNLYRSLYFTIHQLLQPLTEIEQYKVIDRLLIWAGYKPLRRSTYRTLSNKELLTLSSGELIEVGAHTVTHPFFETLPVSLQYTEVQESKSILEEKIGKRVTNFAYPYGVYTQETVEIVRKSGFDSACSTINDTIWRGSDIFQLPRVFIEDCNGDAFKQKLSEWI